ncbi:glycoside hydrolase family 3 protein [Mycena olivaceomarginata]|nr:glycoside hydrolase family 3 protein [Mycena olivaceomarginata]
MLLVALTTLSLCLYAASPVKAAFPDCQPHLRHSQDPITRAKALIARFNTTELVANTVNSVARCTAARSSTHGLAANHGVKFTSSGNFSFATLVPANHPPRRNIRRPPRQIGSHHDQQPRPERSTTPAVRAWTFGPQTLIPFGTRVGVAVRKTPGEDPFHVSQYVLNLIDGLQGGIDPQPYFKVMADCKHLAGYDLESSGGVSRHSFNAIITTQELSEYYLPSFQSCVRDANYNSLNGPPACADPYLLQTILRDYWGFGEDRWVVSDCDAVSDVFATHHFTSSIEGAAAAALKAGTDVNCGSTYSANLIAARNEDLITNTDISNALVRQYAGLVRRTDSWAGLMSAPLLRKHFAYTVAAEGMVLLKNSGNTLPLKAGLKIALIGPLVNATVAMQGNYFGKPSISHQSLGRCRCGWVQRHVCTGCYEHLVQTPAASRPLVAAAKAADVIVYVGGLDNTVEAEGLDRTSLTWPGVQLNLIQSLAAVGKPLVVVQFGGGQVDNTVLKSNSGVNSIIWAGYPGQSGGTALFDIIRGKVAPAGRLPITQYPSTYTSHVAITGNPGRTYKWYGGETVYPFGAGLHYTTFSLAFQTTPAATYVFATLVANVGSAPFLDLGVFDVFNLNVHNTGTVASDFVSLLFVTSTAGPAPHPLKELISYSRVHAVAAGATATTQLKVTLGSIARTDANGSAWLFPGSYTLSLDVPQQLTHAFTLTGTATQLTNFPLHLHNLYFAMSARET